jgi:hypothetical protein
MIRQYLVPIAGFAGAMLFKREYTSGGFATHGAPRGYKPI